MSLNVEGVPDGHPQQQDSGEEDRGPTQQTEDLGTLLGARDPDPVGDAESSGEGRGEQRQGEPVQGSRP